MRRRVIAGNWKMNTTVDEGEALVKGLLGCEAEGVDVIVAPPFTHLDRVKDRIRGEKIGLAAQDLSRDASGAHTGEVSGAMLEGLGVDYAIIGHSERRGRGDTDAVVGEKITRALESGLTPIVCIGEDEAVYASGKRLEFLKGQLHAALEALEGAEDFLIAYEPIWAIGTGKTAEASDAQQVIGAIRAELPETLQESVPILYGGSVKAENVAGFLEGGIIDGALVGGASLKADSFKAIIREASHV